MAYTKDILKYSIVAVTGAVLYFCAELILSPTSETNSRLENSLKEDKSNLRLSEKNKIIANLERELKKLKSDKDRLEKIVSDNQEAPKGEPVKDTPNTNPEIPNPETTEPTKVDKKSFKYRGPNEQVVLELDHELYKPEGLSAEELQKVKDFYEFRYMDIHKFENEEQKAQFLQNEMTMRGYVGNFPLTEEQRKEMLGLFESDELLKEHGRDSFALKEEILKKLLNDSIANGITPEIRQFLSQYDELNLARRYLVNGTLEPKDVNLTPENWGIYSIERLVESGFTPSAPLSLYMQARHEGHFDNEADLILQLRQNE